jgi:hypothetical protein
MDSLLDKFLSDFLPLVVTAAAAWTGVILLHLKRR